jgi:hypothetical protein
MNRNRDYTEYLIKSLFKTHFGEDVIITSIPEEDIEYAIFDNSRGAYDNVDNLEEYAFDYAIFKGNDSQWYYSIAMHSEGITRNGEPVEPPTTTYTESNEGEPTTLKVIIKLIQNTFTARLFDDLIDIDLQYHYKETEEE